MAISSRVFAALASLLLLCSPCRAGGLALHQGALDSDTTAYLNALTGNGCTTPSTTFVRAVDTYIKSERASGNWGSTAAEYILSAPDSCTATVNLAQPSSFKAAVNGDCAFSLINGMTTAAATCYLDLGVNLNALLRYGQNTAYVEWWNDTSSSGSILGLLSSLSSLRNSSTSATRLTRLNASADITDSGNCIGLLWARRTDSATVTTGCNTTTTSSGVASTSNGLNAVHVTVGKTNSSQMATAARLKYARLGLPFNDETAHRTHLTTLIQTCCNPVPDVAYAMVKLFANYSGSAVQLLRLADNQTQDIGFVASGIGSLVDAATADTFCSTACIIAKWYNQNGHANCDATYDTTAHAPAWPGSSWQGLKTIYGARAVSFNSIAHALTNQPASQKYLTVGSSCGFNWGIGNSTWEIAGQVQNSAHPRYVVEYPDSSYGILSGNATSLAGTSMMAWPASSARCGLAMPVSPSIEMFSYQSATISCWNNQLTGTTSAASNGSTASSVHLGSASTVFTDTSDAVAILGWNHTLSDTERTNWRTTLASILSATTTTPTNVLACIGDSMTEGNGSTQNGSHCRRLWEGLSKTTLAYNLAITGSSSASQLARAQYDIPNACPASITVCVFPYMIGVNDIRAACSNDGVTACTSVVASTILPNMRAEVSYIHGLGANRDVVLETTPLQCDIITKANELAAYQLLVTSIETLGKVAQGSGGIGADDVADIWKDTTIGMNNFTTSAFSNSLYSPDCLHPSDTTDGYIAAVEDPVVEAFLQ